MTCEDIIVAVEAQADDRIAEAGEKLIRHMNELLDVNGHRLRPIDSADGESYKCCECCRSARGQAMDFGAAGAATPTGAQRARRLESTVT